MSLRGRGAPRSEFKNAMIAGGNHTFIPRPWQSVLFAAGCTAGETDSHVVLRTPRNDVLVGNHCIIYILRYSFHGTTMDGYFRKMLLFLMKNSLFTEKSY